MDPGATHPASEPPRDRMASIDILRGVVMMLMVLDHARDFFAPFPHPPEDLAHSGPALFMTRWVTHFCAAVFVFLAGTSIFLRQHRHTPSPDSNPGTQSAGGVRAGGLSRFLITRGLWLILLELTLINVSWGAILVGIVILQVIWVLGLSMIVMAGLVRLPWTVSLAVGAAMVGLHNLLDPISASDLARHGPAAVAAWCILHEQAYIPLAGGGPWQPPGIFIVYPVVPWVGVMALGYAFGRVVMLPKASRDRLCLAIGGVAVAMFLTLRLGGLYGEPEPVGPGSPGWPLPAVLNTTKYPPSLQFLLMTIGPSIAALPLLARLGRWGTVPRTFGRVPMLFYLLHIPLLHGASVVVWFALLGATPGWQINPEAWPEGYTPRLWVAYAATAAALAILWWPCRWFMRLRARRRDWWLSYL